MAKKKPTGGQPGEYELYKTSLCIHWTRSGQCCHGAGCHFAHGMSELRPRPPYARIGKKGEEAEQIALASGHGIEWDAFISEKPTPAYYHHAPRDQRGSPAAAPPPTVRKQGQARKKALQAGEGFLAAGRGLLPAAAGTADGPGRGGAWLAAEAGPRTLSDAVLNLMKEHKRHNCVNYLLEMGFDPRSAEDAAGAAGGVAERAVQLLTEGTAVRGWTWVPMAAKPIDVTGEARSLLAFARTLGFGAADVEEQLAMVQGNWEAAKEELELRRAAQASATAYETESIYMEMAYRESTYREPQPPRAPQLAAARPAAAHSCISLSSTCQPPHFPAPTATLQRPCAVASPSGAPAWDSYASGWGPAAEGSASASAPTAAAAAATLVPDSEAWRAAGDPTAIAAGGGGCGQGAAGYEGIAPPIAASSGNGASGYEGIAPSIAAASSGNGVGPGRTAVQQRKLLAKPGATPGKGALALELASVNPDVSQGVEAGGEAVEEAELQNLMALLCT